MSEITNVTVVKEANVFFGGAVTSRTILFADGSKKTLGIMQPGEYSFTTAAPETMEIISGSLKFNIDGETVWKECKGGEAFEVPANTKFTMGVATVTDYCCSFHG